MKIGAVIVTYNPVIKILKQNIDATVKQVNDIVIVDNGSNNINSIKKSIAVYTNVFLIELQHNFGIAKAQNEGIEKLKNKNIEWVLTLDQDTILPTNYIERIVKFIPRFKRKVGIITGAYIDRNWDKERLDKIRKDRNQEIDEFTQEISSGNLVSVKAWDVVGGFDEYLFIDYVDFDFDYRLKVAGYGLYRVNKVEFEHEIGSPIKYNLLTKILLLEKEELFDHSYKRLYYLNRNRIIVRKRYPQFGSPFKITIAEILDLRKVFVMKRPRLRKFNNSLRGIIDGILYKNTDND